MPYDLQCPACGEDDDLKGSKSADGIQITCGQCGATWARDTASVCATCDGDDIIYRPRTMTQHSRGTQLSVVGWQNVPLCLTCDAAALDKSTKSGGPLEANYQPAAMHRAVTVAASSPAAD